MFKWLVWPLGAARIVVVKENIKVRKRKKFQYNRLSGVDKKKKKKKIFETFYLNISIKIFTKERINRYIITINIKNNYSYINNHVYKMILRRL